MSCRGPEIPQYPGHRTAGGGSAPGTKHRCSWNAGGTATTRPAHRVAEGSITHSRTAPPPDDQLVAMRELKRWLNNWRLVTLTRAAIAPCPVGLPATKAMKCVLHRPRRTTRGKHLKMKIQLACCGKTILPRQNFKGLHVWDKPGLSGYLVCLVHLVSLMQPNKPDRPNRPNEQDRLADFSASC